MSPRSRAGSSASTRLDVPQAMDSLEQILRSQLELHGRLMQCLQGKREAIRAADVGTIMTCCEQEQKLAVAIGELERKRSSLMNALTGRNNATKTPGLPVPRLADVLPLGESAQQERLSALGGELRDVVEQMKRISTVVRDAAAALARHMAGVMQTVRSALGPTKVYSRRGHVAAGAPMRFTVDLKS